jgi:hypothetical protein
MVRERALTERKLKDHFKLAKFIIDQGNKLHYKPVPYLTRSRHVRWIKPDTPKNPNKLISDVAHKELHNALDYFKRNKKKAFIELFKYGSSTSTESKGFGGFLAGLACNEIACIVHPRRIKDAMRKLTTVAKDKFSNALESGVIRSEGWKALEEAKKKKILKPEEVALLHNVLQKEYEINEPSVSTNDILSVLRKRISDMNSYSVLHFQSLSFVGDKIGLSSTLKDILKRQCKKLESEGVSLPKGFEEKAIKNLKKSVYEKAYPQNITAHALLKTISSIKDEVARKKIKRGIVSYLGYTGFLTA